MRGMALRGAAMRGAARASVAVAGGLVVLKLAAWQLTDSVSLLSAFADSLVDVLASLINLIAIAIALNPPDMRHRFGHGKAEALAALVQAVLLVGTVGYLLLESLSRLLAPRPLEQPELGGAILAVAIIANASLYVFQRRVVRQTGSLAVAADSLHSKSHVLVEGVAILALVLSAGLGWIYADGALAVIIALYIAVGLWRILRLALDTLMDREIPNEARAQIIEIATRHPDVRGVGGLRTRQAGRDIFAHLLLRLPADLSFARAHAVAHEVEADIRHVLPNTELIIHQEPAPAAPTHVSDDARTGASNGEGKP